MMTSKMTVDEILALIRTNERQRSVAKSRNEGDVVAYHQSAIDTLRRQYTDAVNVAAGNNGASRTQKP